MKLFHATAATLAPGQTIQASRPVSHYALAVAELEKKRPAACPSRSVCVFAAESELHAAAFMTFELPTARREPGAFRVYEVEMETACAGPFALIHYASGRLDRGEPIDKAVGEYWHPTLEWEFLEWFGPSFRVVAEAAKPNDILINNFMLNVYAKDRALAKSL